MRKVESNVLSVREDLGNVESNIGVLTSHILDIKMLMGKGTLGMETRSTENSAKSNLGCHSTTSNAVIQSHEQARIITTTNLPPQESVPPENMGIAQLGNERFPYDKTTVPSPPTIHLSKDINRLFKEWEESNLLVVNGRGIPIKYWGEFYKRGKGVKTTAWDALRVEWGNWKFIAEERQCYPDSASFWRTFSDKNGNPFSYQQILNRLAEHRISAAAQDANNARAFFGGNLDHPLARGAFCYTKGGKTYLSSKDDAIAKRWRELLMTRPDIVEQLACQQ